MKNSCYRSSILSRAPDGGGVEYIRKKRKPTMAEPCVFLSAMFTILLRTVARIDIDCVEMQTKIPMYGDNAFTFLHGRKSEMLQTSVMACHGD